MLLVVMVACSDDPAIDDGSLLSAGSSSVSQSLSSGSESSGSASSQSVPDTEKPVVTLNNLAHGDTVTVSPFFLWGTVTDNSGSTTVYLRLDAAGWQSIAANSTNAWSASLTLTSVGSHSLSWYARDAAGNSTTTNSLTFTYDSGAPTLTISTPPNGGYSRAETLSVGGTASAPAGTSLTTVEVKLDAAAYSAATSGNGWADWSWGPVAAAEGVRTLTARATAANGKTAEKSVTVTLDRTRPTATISAPSATSAGNVTLTIAAADSLSGIQTVRILRDGVVVKTLGPSIPATTTISMLTQGSYTIGIASTDKAGNVSLTNTASITIYAAPVVSISSPTGTGTVVTSPFTISGTASVAGGTITNVFYKFGSGSFAPVTDGGSGFATWSKTVTPTTYGNQTLTVRAYGNMGQYSETSRSFVWDPVRPRAGIELPADASQSEAGSPVVIRITNSDNPGGAVSTLSLAVNGIVVKTWSSPSSSVSLSHVFATADLYVISTWATDAAGNTSLTNEIIVEVVPPLLESASIEWSKGGSTDGGLTVNYSATRAATSYFVVVDSGYPPSVQQVKNGLAHDNSSARHSFTSASQTYAYSWVGGLYSGKSYSVYMVTDDGGISSPVRYAGAFTAGTSGSMPVYPDLVFTEYVEGSSNNKALEVYNGTGTPVLILSNYRVELYLYGGSNSTPVIINAGFGDVVAHGSCYVWTHGSAVQSLIDKADKTAGSLNFAGTHVVLLRRLSDSTIVDSIGSFSQAGPWTGSGVSTQDRTLRRKKNLTAGDSNPNDVFDPSLQWNGYAVDTFSGLGSWQE